MQIVILKDFDCDIIAEHILYPDGQRSLRLDLAQLDVKEPVIIRCRITSFAALEYLLCLVSALRKHDFYINRVEFVYLIGMRSDRAFNAGEPNYFRDINAQIINSLGIENIGFLSPHSLLAYNAIHRVNAYNTFYFPDINLSGAKIGGDQHASGIEVSGLHACFTKERKARDHIEIILDDENKEKIIKELSLVNQATIIDDLCDAGGTFIAGAKCFREYFPMTPLNLYVTHGLFTKGFDVLLEHFNQIYCTNSYQDIDHPKVTQFKVI